MKYRRNLPVLSLLFFSISLWIGSVAHGQLPGESSISQRHLDRVLRSGATDAPAVRALFYQDELDGEDQLCTLLGIRRGPGEILPGLLGFVHRQEVDGKSKNRRLKFKFSKKAQREEGDLMLWVSCLPVEDPDSLPGEQVEITVRRMRQPSEVFVATLPPQGETGGLDIWRHSGGDLESTEYRGGS